jgi:hypothetical protein
LQNLLVGVKLLDDLIIDVVIDRKEKRRKPTKQASSLDDGGT